MHHTNLSRTEFVAWFQTNSDLQGRCRALTWRTQVVPWSCLLFFTLSSGWSSKSNNFVFISVEACMLVLSKYLFTFSVIMFLGVEDSRMWLKMCPCVCCFVIITKMYFWFDQVRMISSHPWLDSNTRQLHTCKIEILINN